MSPNFFKARLNSKIGKCLLDKQLEPVKSWNHDYTWHENFQSSFTPG